MINFSPGPAVLPRPVLEQLRDELVALPGVGVSPLEISHRSAWFDDVIGEAEANLRLLLAIPEAHRVIFCQGGATQQFAMAALNLGGDRPADYVVTGSWGEKAFEEAVRIGSARIRWSGEDGGFVRVPGGEELRGALHEDAAYVHATTNETIQGVEFPATPEVPAGARLVVDASSDFLSRPMDVGRHALIYAGAQKNAGPAGVTVAIVRDDALERIPDGMPAMLDYRTYTEHESRYNTPPVFAIYVLMLVTRWLRDDVGGLDRQLDANRAKAGMVYAAIDGSDGFYRGHAEPGSRSLMNVTFRLATPELDAAFVADAAREGLIELRGHRSVGGIRASLYNAMPPAGAEALAGFMNEFRAGHA